MRTSDKGIALVKQHEGLRLEAYPDPAHGWSVPTIGFGHTSAAGSPKVTRGMRITAEGADTILRNDLRAFEGYVASAVHVPLTQEQFDALVSFTFNLGPGNLKKSTLLKRLNAGDYAAAADQFLVWNKAGGKVLSGLTKRRGAERALFLSATPARPTPQLPPATAPAADPIRAWVAPAAILAVFAAVILFAILS